MAVELNGKATEKQRKYLGYLSSQGKEKFGKDFSIRKLAEQRGIIWEEMTQEQASSLIEEVKAMVETDFMIDDKQMIEQITEEAKKQEATKPPASISPQVYMIQLYLDDSKLQAVEVVLEAMNIGYVVLKEVRG